MPLNSTEWSSESHSITRVIGGWIYTHYYDKACCSCFVPEPQKEDVICVTDHKVEFNDPQIKHCTSEFTCNFPNCKCFGDNKPAAVISNRETKVVKYTDEKIQKFSGGNGIGGDI